MSLGAQARRLNELAGAFRQALFGEAVSGSPVQISYNRGEHTHAGYYSPFKSEARTDEAGYMEEFDGVVRFAKTVGYVPQRDAQITIEETQADAGPATPRRIDLTIKSIRGFHANSGEWVLGCKALN